jgi:hypothetical protein
VLLGACDSAMLELGCAQVDSERTVGIRKKRFPIADAYARAYPRGLAGGLGKALSNCRLPVRTLLNGVMSMTWNDAWATSL